MSKRKWIWLICLSPLIGLEIYDGVQGAITGLAMRKYCEAEAGLTLYPNVKYEYGNDGYCFQHYRDGCPNKTVITRSFIPVFGAVSTPQRIYIMSKKHSSFAEEELRVFLGSGLVREVHRYFTEDGESLGEYIYFKPNGVPHSLAGPVMYDLMRSKKFFDGGHGCYIPKIPHPDIDFLLFRSNK